MAHFAEVDENNIVTRVLVVPNEQESRGAEYLAIDLGLGGRWIQTSYNTVGNVHLNGGTPLRYNYAGVGFTYDEDRDAFVPPRPYPSWSVNWDTGFWEPPVPAPVPLDGAYWDEDSLSWVRDGAE